MTKQEEIQQLKKKRDAVILAHYYVDPEVQKIADYIGDSFYLSKIAAGLKNQTLVFCGVSFMGESGKLLSPDKIVLMPDQEADCPMAHMVSKEDVARFRKEYPDLAVVCYVNSTAEIKSWSDVCVTSANAAQIVKNLPNKNILFIPDKNLGRYVANQLPEKNVLLVRGYCPVHERMSADEVLDLKKEHPSALVLAHPECNEKVLTLADFAGSTSGILQYAAKSSAEEFIICTETGVRYELERENQKKRFYFPKTEPICEGMKRITLDKIIEALESGKNESFVSEEFASQARDAMKRMLELAK